MDRLNLIFVLRISYCLVCTFSSISLMGCQELANETGKLPTLAAPNVLISPLVPDEQLEGVTKAKPRRSPGALDVEPAYMQEEREE